MEENNPLVSVRVGTYNSSKFIIDTLESIKAQTYKNIELIISDDASSDNTIDICKEWIETNRSRFVNVHLLTIEKNTGIPANMNRSIPYLTGKWVKACAGDDVLLPWCIETFINYVNAHPDVMWVSSKMFFYNEKINDECKDVKRSEDYYSDDYKKLFDLQAEEQLIAVAYKNFINALSLFVRRDLFNLTGPYVEKYTLCEDYPMNIMRLEHGIKLSFIDEYTVGYRVRQKSASGNQGKRFNMKFVSQVYAIKKQYCFKYISFKEKTHLFFQYHIRCIMDYCGFNNNAITSNPIFLFFRKIYYGNRA